MYQIICIKNRLENIFDKKEIKLYYPIKEMMSTMSMIAWAALKTIEKIKMIFF